jgi:hypothetical protein
MSKGYGAKQRKLLDGVSDDWQPVVYLAADIEGEVNGRVRRSVEESYRRAAKRLAAAGVVELAYQSMVWSPNIRAEHAPDVPHGNQRARLVVRRAQEATS